MHRVLLIPELLDVVFAFLDEDSNAANARVCRRWSDVALDVLWKDVDDLLCLFRLLKPICHHEDLYEYCFEALPEASDWARFEKYASRVRSLKFRPTKYDCEICPLLDDVARTRTSLEILPNMHTLEWLYTSPAHMERCKLFLHPRLRKLSVTAPSQLHPRPDFYTDLCARAPRLQSLALYVTFPGGPIDAELRVLLQNLPDLKTIILPEFHYTSAIIEELSRAKNIAVVDFDQDLKLGCGNVANVASFAPVLRDGAFPCLRELNLSARIDHVDRFFRASFAPTRLTKLHLNSYSDHPPAELHSFLTTLSEQCLLLTKLCVQLYHKSLPPLPSPDLQVSYDTIKPVLAFPALSTFELVHKYPLRISLDELDELASKLPHIECIVLNAEPLFIAEYPCTLDLRALLPFAQHCPRIRHLGLYIDATAAQIPAADPPFAPFSATLRALSVGTSQARDPSAVATFLSRICPPQCCLDLGITWTEFGSEENRFLPPDLRQVLQARCVVWQAVENLLPTLIQLRHEEAERSRALREEVEDLRVRNRLLLDQADTTKTKDSCVVA